MIKKKQGLITFITIILVLVFNGFIYFFYGSINDKINENNNIKNDIKVLNELKDEVVRMAHAEKLWIATGKSDYKNKFEEELENVNNKLDTLYDTGKIDENSKNELKNSVEKYKKLSYELSLNENNFKISNEQENAFLEFNNLQLDILKNSTNSIAGVDEALKQSNDLILNSSESQKSFLQIISWGIGIIVSSISYFFNKKTPKEQIDSTVKVLDCIFDKEDGENNEETKDKEVSFNNQVISLDNYKDINNIKTLEKCTEIINELDIIYKLAIKYENDLEESKVTLGKIEIIIKYLKDKIENEECKKEDEKNYIKDLEYGFNRLNILFTSLESYNLIIREKINLIKKD